MNNPSWLQYKGDLISVENTPLKSIQKDNGGNIVFMFRDGTTRSFPQVDAESAFQNLAVAVNAQNPAPLSIVSVSPNPFDITTDTITITGTGFSPGSIGILYIEDSGGQFNGYAMACTYVNETTLTAVFLTAGDSFLDSGCYLVYRDLNGKLSNTIPVTLAGTVATV